MVMNICVFFFLDDYYLVIFKLNDVIDFFKMMIYFWYYGSLIIFECYESVIWIVFDYIMGVLEL